MFDDPIRDRLEGYCKHGVTLPFEDEIENKTSMVGVKSVCITFEINRDKEEDYTVTLPVINGLKLEQPKYLKADNFENVEPKEKPQK